MLQNIDRKGGCQSGFGITRYIPHDKQIPKDNTQTCYNISITQLTTKNMIRRRQGKIQCHIRTANCSRYTQEAYSKIIYCVLLLRFNQFHENHSMGFQSTSFIKSLITATYNKFSLTENNAVVLKCDELPLKVVDTNDEQLRTQNILLWHTRSKGNKSYRCLQFSVFKQRTVDGPNMLIRLLTNNLLHYLREDASGIGQKLSIHFISFY